MIAVILPRSKSIETSLKILLSPREKDKLRTETKLFCERLSALIFGKKQKFQNKQDIVYDEGLMSQTIMKIFDFNVESNVILEECKPLF